MAKVAEQSISTSTVDASPTKSFFISVLIKDIDFIDALIELIDNSVDAVRARFGEDGLKRGLVDVSYSTTQVRVQDNGVGITIDQAHQSAFRFGRPLQAKVVSGSVGAFGVGMKRALFKIGRRFEVESWTETEHFRVPVDVAEWEKDDQGPASQWTFHMEEQETGLANKATGTVVLVERLHDYSKDELRSATFGTRLRDKLQSAHEYALSKGMKIRINDDDLDAKAPELRIGRKLKPIHIEDTLQVEKSTIAVRIYAGVEDEALRDAGWYVFCNGRLIEKAEKTRRTGWDTALDSGDKTPRPHWQFRRFRGYIFFDSSASGLLPWNTMKTGLNMESPVYRQVYPRMTLALREVISFLNALDGEEDENGPLHKSIKDSKLVQLKSIPINAAFKSPAPASADPKMARISFKRDADLVERVREELGVETNQHIGESLFDSFVRRRKLL